MQCEECERQRGMCGRCRRSRLEELRNERAAQLVAHQKLVTQQTEANFQVLRSLRDITATDTKIKEVRRV